MGVYYKAVCDELQESIDPGRINDGGVKGYAIAHPTHEFGPVVILAMLGRWRRHSVRLVTHENPHADNPYHSYTDVTKQVIAEYNSLYGDSVLELPILPIIFTEIID